MSVARLLSRLSPMEALMARELTGAPFGPQFALERYIPPRGVPARTADLVKNRRVRNRMEQVIEQGRAMGGHLWYDTQPLQDAFTAELGDAGPAAFRKFIQYQAAVSPRARVPEQIRRGSYFYGRDMSRVNEPIPLSNSELPEMYGHYAHKTHTGLIGDVLHLGQLQGGKTKAASFAQNLSGNQVPATIDSHAVALPAILSEDPRFLKTSYNMPVSEDSFGWTNVHPQRMFASGELTLDDALERPVYWGGRPRKSEYAAFEDYYAKLGRRQGLTPAQAQSAAWVGGGDLTGLQSEAKPFVSVLIDRIKETARQRGLDPNDVLRRMIRGEEPLLGVGGGLAAGGILEALRRQEGA